MLITSLILFLLLSYFLFEESLNWLHVGGLSLSGDLSGLNACSDLPNFFMLVIYFASTRVITVFIPLNFNLN